MRTQNIYIKSVFMILISTFMAVHVQASEAAPLLTSPDGHLTLKVQLNTFGQPVYELKLNNKTVIKPSRLGMQFKQQHSFDQANLISRLSTKSVDQTWELPWGERRYVHNNYNQFVIEVISQIGRGNGGHAWKYHVEFRLFNDGLGFRYIVPEQKGYKTVEITNELTEFHVDEGSKAWWIPARGWNRYEYLYKTTGLADIQTVHTPFTLKTTGGAHVVIHEAALVDYAGMSLSQGRAGKFKADLAPKSDGILVQKNTPFKTPWRTIQVGSKATDLLNSNMILNLNEPNKLGDVSWVKPGKYIGIWWGMHVGDNTWGRDGVHGATTKETKRYIDFAAKYGFSGVLVEGWNIGWDGDWFNNGDVFNFTKSYDDYDFKGLAAYAKSKGVSIVGHHETSGNITNYEKQMTAAYQLMQRRGVSQIKTGYVADGGNIKRIDDKGIVRKEFHDSQHTVNHYLKSVKEAAKHKISINTHEPIKDTGLRRTYPNWISREGARGQEYNAWGNPPNTPEHTAILPYTRMMSGPMDFTPGIFNLEPSKRKKTDPRQNRHGHASRIQTTLAKQLALYVVIYSPIQMAADLPEHYEARPKAFQFIRDVPTDWEDSLAIAGEIGEYVVYARKERAGDDWYLGGLTDHKARTVKIDLSFLGDGNYVAEIYRDGKGADWKTNPYAFERVEQVVSAKNSLALWMASSGGTAIRFRKLQKMSK